MFTWLTHLRIRTKLNAMTAAFLLGIVAFAWMSRDTIETVKIGGGSYERIVESKDLLADVLPPPAYAIEAYLVAYELLDAVEANDKVQVSNLESKAKQLRESYQAREAYWSRTLKEGELKQSLTAGAYGPGARFFEIWEREFSPAVSAGDKAKVHEVMRTKLAPAYQEHRSAIDRVVKLSTDRNHEDEAKAAALVSQRSTYFFVIALVFMALAWAVGFGTTRAIVGPLQRIVSVLRKTSETNDLTLRVGLDGKDEVAEAAHSFDALVDKLQGMLIEARTVADVVGDSARAMAESADEISSGAQSQASSLEETAASIEEIAATSRQNADNARRAAELAERSRDVAEVGGRVIDSAVSAMNEIAASSGKISEIINTIDDIAFQTNILALNAAVEAARAGEHGRGFAIVASEVRGLAQRSAGAAKEISRLIGDSIAKVDSGASHVNESGSTLKEIVTSVKRVTDMIAEISAASQEQHTGVSQVNQAVSQVDQVTQANAARTEEMSATASSLASEADRLRSLVKRFRLADGESPREIELAPSAPTAPNRKSNGKRPRAGNGWAAATDTSHFA